MKKFSNFWKYFTITILLLLGLACAGILYMFFVGAPLFNFKYVSYNKDYFSKQYMVNKEVSPTIKLTNGRFDVKIYSSGSTSLSLKVHNGVFGFTTKQSANFSLDESVDENTYTFTISEPHGFAATGRSFVELYLPDIYDGVNLILSNTGAKTVFDADLSVQNLSYSTRSGDFQFNKGHVGGQLNLSLGRSTFTIGKDVDTGYYRNDVNLKMTSGCFNCADKDFKKVNILSSTSGVVRIGRCQQISGENEDSGGSITINEVANANLLAGDTNVRITTLDSGIIEIGKTGRINIGNIAGRVNLHTKSGNITVEKSEFELACTTSSGNIKIEKAVKVINAETDSGDIDINFDFDENTNDVINKTYTTKNSYIDDKDNRRAIVKTNSGNISCYGVENIDALITGSGHANIYMENVLGDNIVKAERGGSVYLQVREFTNDIMPEGWAHFMLNAQCYGAVYVNFSQMSPTYGINDSNYGLKTIDDEYINPSSSYTRKNSLTAILNSGSLTILDTISSTIKK